MEEKHDTLPVLEHTVVLEYINLLISPRNAYTLLILTYFEFCLQMILIFASVVVLRRRIFTWISPPTFLFPHNDAPTQYHDV
jgi:hypothetical protein